jgi:hypothetical protein
MYEQEIKAMRVLVSGSERGLSEFTTDELCEKFISLGSYISIDENNYNYILLHKLPDNAIPGVISFALCFIGKIILERIDNGE